MLPSLVKVWEPSLSERLQHEAFPAAQTSLEPTRSPTSVTGAQPQRPTSLASYPEFLQRIQAEIPFLKRTARRWLREGADAEDLVQDTLVLALANAHLWQPGTDLCAWLFTIMRNRFLAGMTKSTRSAAALERIATTGSGQPTDAIELRLLLRDLTAALRRLPGNQRSAVLLIGVEGKSYDEAANVMGTSVAAMRSRLARGRERLRAVLHGSDMRPPFAARAAGTSPAAPRKMPPALAATGND